METQESLEIAKTIIEQLGGTGKLRAMLGVKNFVHDHGDLSFNFKGSRKVNEVTIHLNGSDLYDMTFYKISRTSLSNPGNCTELKKYTDLYNDQLKETFEDFTGLKLSL